MTVPPAPGEIRPIRPIGRVATAWSHEHSRPQHEGFRAFGHLAVKQKSLRRLQARAPTS
jgi:hypothetical protein